jgi:hypothetical protein
MTIEYSDVEATLDGSGQLLPVAFSYEGNRVVVVSYGRQWNTEEAHHYLVMDSQRRVYELAHNRAEDRWVLKRTPESFGSSRPGAA